MEIIFGASAESFSARTDEQCVIFNLPQITILISSSVFNNDMFRYSPDKRKFVLPACPGPRSAHAVVYLSKLGWQAFSVRCVSFLIQLQSVHFSLRRGEFSLLHLNSFYQLHCRDFWFFDPGIGLIPRYARVRDPDIGGCNDRFTWLFLYRMAVWEHYIILFGGLYDPGITGWFSYL